VISPKVAEPTGAFAILAEFAPSSSRFHLPGRQSSPPEASDKVIQSPAAGHPVEQQRFASLTRGQNMRLSTAPGPLTHPKSLTTSKVAEPSATSGKIAMWSYQADLLADLLALLALATPWRSLWRSLGATLQKIAMWSYQTDPLAWGAESTLVAAPALEACVSGKEMTWDK